MKQFPKPQHHTQKLLMTLDIINIIKIIKSFKLYNSKYFFTWGIIREKERNIFLKYSKVKYAQFLNHLKNNFINKNKY